jgi:hypothetical protein
MHATVAAYAYAMRVAATLLWLPEAIVAASGGGDTARAS